MKKILFLLLLGNIFIFGDELDSLLNKIEQESTQLKSFNRQKEAKFLQEKNTQKEALEKIKTKIALLKMQNKKTQALYDTQAKEIASLKEKLSLKAVNLEELFGLSKQASSDLFASAKSSLLRAKYPLKPEFLSLVKSKKLPSAKELETLWTTYLKEIINAGKIANFQTDVILKDGTKKALHVTTIGSFTAFNEKGFLRFKDTILHEYPKQPTQYLSYANPLNTNNQLQNIAIDPTKGSLLNLESLKPSLNDRIKQAGSIGYVIIILGVIGFFIAMFQFVRLSLMDQKVKKQIKNIHALSSKNPLGRVLIALENEKSKENLEAKLNQSLLKESAKISTIKSFIKLLASVAPMLGLLGTVVGMIATFQAITLFGTGEPQLMAGGISQALITTVLGLIVAIPLLFLYALLNSKSQSIIQIIYEQSLGLMVQRKNHD